MPFYSGLKRLLNRLLDYRGVVTAPIDSKLLAVIRILIWAIILLYIIISTFADYGYQKRSPILSYVTTKLKKSNCGGNTLLDDDISEVIPGVNKSLTMPEDFRVWEIADNLIPHRQDSGVFFVITHVVVNALQTEGFSNSKRKCDPEDHKNCIIGEPIHDAFSTSVMTGNCTENVEGKHTCETHGWISEEVASDRDIKPLYIGSKYFTVLIKNVIRFPLFPQYRTMNIIHDEENFECWTNCTYDKEIRPFCAIFTLGSIVEAAGQNYAEMSRRGGVIRITINWDCNLDYNPKKCKPQYTFQRLDDPNPRNVRYGWNFRFTLNSNATHRTVYRAYGIKFDVSVTGHGRKFDFVHCSRSIGSQLAYFGIATLICQLVLRWCMTKKFQRCQYQQCNCPLIDHELSKRSVMEMNPSKQSITEPMLSKETIIKMNTE